MVIVQPVGDHDWDRERTAAVATPPRLIDDAAGLGALLDELAAVDRYAIDTEFHRERTYYPRLAFIQLAWGGGVALVDPLAVDVLPLGAVFADGATAVFHAADQDLEILERATGAVPSRIFDTQIAAGFLGHGTPSLQAITERILHLRLPKGDRLTDWSRRPLTETQISYAASDVAHLLELADALLTELEERGRREWAEQECADLLARPHGDQDPETAWWRLRDSRQLRGASRGVAQSVAAWRERQAMARDIPPRFVLPDLSLLSIAQRPPKTAGELREVRGLDGRHLKGVADQLLATITEGRRLPDTDLRLPRVEEVGKDLRPAVALAAAWVAQMAKDMHIDAGLLATRSDLVHLLRDDPQARLRAGWRASVVGEPVRRLTAGEAALAFDGHGGLVLEERSRRPVRPS
jgi:ribonuclease D